MTSDDSVVTLNTLEAHRSLEILRAFGEAGQAELDMTHDQARQAFSAGMIGILIDSSSGLTGLERQAAGNFHVAIAPFPLKAGAGHLSAAGGLAVMLARDPVRQRAAWKCMKFLCGPIAQTIMGQHTAYVPLNTIAISRPDLLGKAYEQPSKQILLSQLPNLAASYAFPRPYSAKIDSLINDILQQIVVLSETPQAALTRMQKEIGPLFARRGTN
jgi:multiple sugar transport system substrate-binding protein